MLRLMKRLKLTTIKIKKLHNVSTNDHYKFFSLKTDCKMEITRHRQNNLHDIIIPNSTRLSYLYSPHSNRKKYSKIQICMNIEKNKMHQTDTQQNLNITAQKKKNK